MTLAMVKYNAGNVKSVGFALQRLGITPVVTDDTEELMRADKVLFPGVGNAASAMASLREKGLDKLIPRLKQPVLGICLGMQLLCLHTEEGDTSGLGVIPIAVKKFRHIKKVPHTGWNTICNLKSELFTNIPEGEYMYFVHSFYAVCGTETIATCNYEIPFSASLHKGNFYGIQFHPEISSEAGSRVLSNFLNIKS